MIRLVFDCLRSPYDFANILQVCLAVENCEIFVTGNSLNHEHKKIFGKVRSWMKDKTGSQISEIPIHYIPEFKQCVSELKKNGIRIIGTSPYAKKSFYDVDFNDNGEEVAIVFGTEATGLSRLKQELLDEIVCIPMSEKLNFLTLSVAVPAIVYEIKRQKSKTTRV